MRKFKCNACGHTWELPFGQGGRGIEQICPNCSSRSILRVGRFNWLCGRRSANPDVPNFRGGRGGGGGWRHRRGL